MELCNLQRLEPALCLRNQGEPPSHFALGQQYKRIEDIVE
jgi:hypothetical protein